jgi:hypothetical protein
MPCPCIEHNPPCGRLAAVILGTPIICYLDRGHGEPCRLTDRRRRPEELPGKLQAAHLQEELQRAELTPAERLELWEAVNRYMVACRGQEELLSGERMDAVVAVEDAVRKLLGARVRGAL